MAENKQKLKLFLSVTLSVLAIVSLVLAGYQYFKKTDQLASKSKNETIITFEEKNPQAETIPLSENTSENTSLSPEKMTDEEKQTIDNATNDADSEEAQKEEPPAPVYDLVVGLIADAHAGQKHGFTHLNSAVWTLKNNFNPDIVVDVGDLIESRNKDGFISKKDAKADFRKSRNIITAYFPLYNVIGNHELLSMSKDEVNEITGRKNYYATTVKNGYRLIILDANYTNEETHIDAKHDDSFIYTGTLSTRQLGLLENELKKNDKNLIFIHHPLWNLTNKNEVSKILKKYQNKIALIANGHKHPNTLETISLGNVQNYNLPSAYHQHMVSVAKINGLVAEVSVKKY